MRTIWHALAWKEWHEHKWKLAALVAIIVGVSSVPILNYDFNSIGAAVAISLFCIAPLAIFIGAGAATGERARGTLAFTQSLPVPTWQLATHKLFFGWLTCVVPVIVNLALVACAFLVLQLLNVKPSPRLTSPFGNDNLATVQMGHWLAYSAISVTAMATSFYLWTAAIGVNRKDEISASAWSLLAFVLWWTALVLILTSVAAIVPRTPTIGNQLLPAIFAASPGGYAIFNLSPPKEASRWPALAIAILVQCGMAAAFIGRFGRSPNREIVSPRAAAISSRRAEWLAPPRSSPCSALVWKQCRESGPIVLAGLAGVVSTAVLPLIAHPEAYDVRTAGQFLAGTTAYFGAVVTLVVGIGVFLNDLSPNLNTFWRSRPVNPNAWFWIKFATGLAVLMATFSIPLALSVVWGGIHRQKEFGEMAAWTCLAPLWIYSAAVLLTCVVRHAIYAGILSLSAMYLGLLLVVGLLRWARLGFDRSVVSGMFQPTFAELATGMIVSTIAFTVLAWLAIRNDWGRKSRY